MRRDKRAVLSAGEGWVSGAQSGESECKEAKEGVSDKKMKREWQSRHLEGQINRYSRSRDCVSRWSWQRLFANLLREGKCVGLLILDKDAA